MSLYYLISTEQGIGYFIFSAGSQLLCGSTLTVISSTGAISDFACIPELGATQVSLLCCPPTPPPSPREILLPSGPNGPPSPRDSPPPSSPSPLEIPPFEPNWPSSPTTSPSSPPPPPPAKPTVANYQIWLNTYKAGNTHVSVTTVKSVLCPALKTVISDALLAQGIDPDSVFVKSLATNGGCSAVTALPSSSNVVRVASKFLLSLSPSQWLQLGDALIERTTVTRGHMLCGSAMFFETSPGGVEAWAPLSPTSAPSWLDASAGAATCYTDMNAPFKT